MHSCALLQKRSVNTCRITISQNIHKILNMNHHCQFSVKSARFCEYPWCTFLFAKCKTMYCSEPRTFTRNHHRLALPASHVLPCFSVRAERLTLESLLREISRFRWFSRERDLLDFRKYLKNSLKLTRFHKN